MGQRTEAPVAANELRLIVELVPVSPEEAESLAKRQLEAMRRFLVRLDQVRQTDVSSTGGSLIETTRDAKEVDLP